MVIDGVDYGNPSERLKFFGFKEDNRLYIENYNKDNVSQYKWGIQFSPALIVDGEIYVQGSFGYGLQPRSAIGKLAQENIQYIVRTVKQKNNQVIKYYKKYQKILVFFL